MNDDAKKNPRYRANIMLIGQQAGEEGRALKYDPKYCMEIRDMAQDGKFPEEWCAHIGVTITTIYNWANRYPEFDEAVRIAWHILHAYYSEKARKIVENPLKYNVLKATVFLEILRKRFPSTWGKEPRNTAEDFDARDRTVIDGDAMAFNTPERIKDADTSDLVKRLEELEARRKAEKK